MSQAFFVCRINDWKDQLALGMGRFWPPNFAGIRRKKNWR